MLVSKKQSIGFVSAGYFQHQVAKLPAKASDGFWIKCLSHGTGGYLSPFTATTFN